MNIKRMSPEVRDDVIAACNHVMFEHQRMLLEKLQSVPRRNVLDVDFVDLICGTAHADVCPKGEDLSSHPCQ